MDWIERQIERQRERLVVGIHRWILEVGFDRRQRLRAFRRLIVCQLIYVVLLEWTSLQISFIQTPAIVLLKIGLVSTTFVEYLAMIRVGWNNFGGVARAVEKVNHAACSYAAVACVLTVDDHRDPYLRIFMCLIIHLFVSSYQNARWYVGVLFSSKPFFFQIRKSIPGQQNPQMLQVVVWVYQDLCLLFNAQVMANLPPIHALNVHEFAWPTMDEAPRWILKKLSENAAMAG